MVAYAHMRHKSDKTPIFLTERIQLFDPEKQHFWSSEALHVKKALKYEKDKYQAEVCTAFCTAYAFNPALSGIILPHLVDVLAKRHLPVSHPSTQQARTP